MTQDQKGVARGMAVGAAITLAVVLSPLYWEGRPILPSQPVELLSAWLLAASSVVFWLFVCIARLARHRFFSSDDINGTAGQNATRKAGMLQSILQNTLEQSVLAVVVYGAWLFLAPADWRVVAILCAGLFSLGRLLFILGYARGAPSRALGFALTFYPSAALLFMVLALQIHGRL